MMLGLGLGLNKKSKVAASDPFGPELYTVNNALARVPYEANATTGISNQGLSGFAVGSSTPSPQEGSYYMRLEATTAIDRMEITTSLPSGKTYQIRFWGWTESSVLARMRTTIGITDGTPLATLTTTPTEYTINVTTNATSQTFRWYVEGNDVEVYVEGLSIREVL